MQDRKMQDWKMQDFQRRLCAPSKAVCRTRSESSVRNVTNTRKQHVWAHEQGFLTKAMTQIQRRLSSMSFADPDDNEAVQLNCQITTNTTEL